MSSDAAGRRSNSDLVEISIVPGSSALGDGPLDARVDITSMPFSLMELAGRIVSAENQSIPLSAGSELQLGRLLGVNPIQFLHDGRWRLSLRATHAELALLG